MRKYGGFALLAAASLALSGCASDEALPQPSAAPEAARAAVSTESFEDIQEEIFASVADADAELDADLLADRATGPFATIRKGEYTLKNVLADSYGLEKLSASPIQTAVSSAQNYPHSAISVMEAPKGSNLQTISVFQQPTARENWKLWGVLDILPGATFPALSLEESSASTIAQDEADGLVASPSDALAGYAKAAQSGKNPDNMKFTDDKLRDTLAKGKESNAEAIGDAGTVDMGFKVADVDPVSFATDDGGALVVGRLNFTTKIEVTEENATVTLGSTIGALASGEADGEIEVSGTLTANYTVMVAIHIPADGAEDEAITTIGASDPVLIKVKNG
ncbi:hypothetical protein [Ancrocorticia populi]|uniref:hypothetical protein n=1 Tax=Ancrocorticia populi TaxID=2175228 RepID=UPI0023573985|nr:hypothetical protein [Ancrocorticia populi]